VNAETKRNLGPIAEALAIATGATPEDAAQVRSAVEHTDRSTCAWCKKPIGEYRDELSRREAAISGTCQPCQDFMFADPDEEGAEVEGS
jgi:hypothetical protein